MIDPNEGVLEPVSQASDHLEAVIRLRRKRDRLLSEIAKLIVGQSEVINQLLIALISGGHSLLLGVPGLAKTSIVRTFAQLLDLRFRRIQFTEAKQSSISIHPGLSKSSRRSKLKKPMPNL